MEPSSVKRCRVCGEQLEGRFKTAYCSKRCVNEQSRRNYRALNPHIGQDLPTGTTGAIAELRVACDLLYRDYEVFRSLSPSCSCDLAILKHGNLSRIEVRTAYYNKNGSMYHNTPKGSKYDIYAAVLPDKIVYEPELP